MLTPDFTDGYGRPLRGKARGLAELQAAGFPVPEFRCSPRDAAAAAQELGFPLAVRSSASSEDGQLNSFAGQFRTFLQLQTTEAVTSAIAACEQSLLSSSVAAYCRKAGIPPDSLSMQVILQKMIQPELAGVAFSINPMTGEEDVVIEACEGVADDLLAGQLSPLPAGHPLLEHHRSRITALVRAVHEHCGTPQDVEFAIADGQLYLLQARPITRIAFRADTGEWTNADFRDGGVSSSVCTPLMWSLYDFIWEDALKDFLRDLHLHKGNFTAGRMFFGRPYWNLGAVKECLLRLPGFDEAEFDRDLSVQRTADTPYRRTPVTAWTVLRALPTIIAAPSLMKRQDVFDSDFLEGGFEQMAARFADPGSHPHQSLETLINTLYRTTETNYFRTIFCASLAKLLFMEAFPGADYPALVAALPPLRHLEPTLMIRRMQTDGAPDPDALMRRFPHRSRRELDLRTPRWDEDRPWVEALLNTPAGPEMQDPSESQRAALKAALSSVPRHRRSTFQRKLNRLRRFLWLREEMRDLSSRTYHLIRRHVIAIAELRGLGDDAFFMTWRELIADDRSSIAASRRRFQSYRNFAAPNEIGSRFPSAPNPHSGDLRGIGASPGCASGIARRARSIEEALTVERGSILVCPFTDPGWTPVLERVAAVVTETGGLLSHAAVICREYGIPAVLGLPNATTRIPEGSPVTVNGSAGTVSLT
ncbi:MAG: PEP/pyruvate-binding domain-containing protein [Verrucomicrobiota bacterium]